MDRFIECMKLKQEKETDLDDDDNVRVSQCVCTEHILLMEFISNSNSFISGSWSQKKSELNYFNRYHWTLWLQTHTTTIQCTAWLSNAKVSRCATACKACGFKKDLRRKYRGDSELSLDDDDNDVRNITPGGTDLELNWKSFDWLTTAKSIYNQKFRHFHRTLTQDIKTYIDNKNANQIAQYLKLDPIRSFCSREKKDDPKTYQVS